MELDKVLTGDVSKGVGAGQGAESGVPAPLFGTSSRAIPRSDSRVSAARQRKLHVGHFAFIPNFPLGIQGG